MIPLSTRVVTSPIHGAMSQTNTQHGTLPARTFSADGSEQSPGAWHASSTLLASCALVATAYFLGATWLATPTLGVPVGLWLIVVAVGVLRMDARRAANRLAGGANCAEPDAALWKLAGMTCRVVEAGARWSRPICDQFGFLAASGSRAASRLSALHDKSGWPERQLRIGLAVGPDVADALRATPGASGVQWVPLTLISDPTAACKAYALDAVVQSDPTEGLVVTTLERAGRDAAWYDWSVPRPLTYASAFPFLLDPARITLGLRSITPGAEAELVRAMIEAASVLSRSTHRVGLADRLIGRRPTDAVRIGSGDLPRVDRAMLRLAKSFETNAERVDSSFALLVARVLSADLCAGQGRTWATAELWNLITKVAGDEPEVALREAASRFVMLEDDRGMAALSRADRALRHQFARLGQGTSIGWEAIDHTLLLEWELEHGAASDQAIGRLAAGICLACAGRDVHGLACVRDDLFDDMRHSTWLVGRDQDQALLLDVFRHLERTRRAEAIGLTETRAA